MPTIGDRRSTRVSGGSKVADQITVQGEIDSTPRKRRLRSSSSSTAEDSVGTSNLTLSPMKSSPSKWKSPRRCVNDSPKSSQNVIQLLRLCYVFSICFLLQAFPSGFVLIGLMFSVEFRQIAEIKQ